MAGLIFWDVDTQRDFMLADGKLYVPGAEEIIANLQRLTKHARSAGIRIVASADDHSVTDEEISDEPDFTVTYPPHCMHGTPGQQRIPETRPENPLVIGMEPRDPNELASASREHKGEIVILKHSVRVFDNPNTMTIVDALQPDEVVVYGVALDICNRHAVEGLLGHRPQAAISVVTDATKPIDAELARTLLESWKQQGVRTITTDEALRKGAGVEVGG